MTTLHTTHYTLLVVKPATTSDHSIGVGEGPGLDAEAERQPPNSHARHMRLQPMDDDRPQRHAVLTTPHTGTVVSECGLGLGLGLGLVTQGLW